MESSDGRSGSSGVGSRMASIWVESLGRNFAHALGLLEAATRDCPDELWESSMWTVPAADAPAELHGPDGRLVIDDSRHARLQRKSTPWGMAWHALEVLDYDLTGEFGPWSPPPPFTGKAHWRDLPLLPTAWSRSDMLGYVDYCLQRVRDTLKGMTDEKAATRLPRAHRYHGQPFAWILTALPGHTIEHASQMRQFITAAGVTPTGRDRRTAAPNAVPRAGVRSVTGRRPRGGEPSAFPGPDRR